MSEPYWEPLAAAPASSLPPRLGTGTDPNRVTDANAAVQSGWYFIVSTGANLPTPASEYQLEVIAVDATYITQVAYEIYTGATFVRRRTSSGWTAWSGTATITPPHSTAPPASPVNGQIWIQYVYDNWMGGYVTNEFAYIPGLDASKPWHFIGGPGYTRKWDNVHGGGGSAWTWAGQAVDLPKATEFYYDLEWREENTAGESQGYLGIGDQAGSIPVQVLMSDTGAARFHRRINGRLGMGAGPVGLWSIIYDTGNPCYAWEPVLRLTPIRCEG